jgi:predicted O-methyltransferase YrrM
MARGLRHLLNIDAYDDLFRSNTRERLLKGLSPRYAYHKLRLLFYERSHPESPLLTQDSLELIAAYLRPQHVGFEWGSGIGSIWFAQRSARLVSVEHNPRWAEVVQSSRRQRAVQNMDYRLVSEGAYVATIDEFPDRTFDYLLVDGLFRDEAFYRSLPKVKPGGWLIFDNVNWYIPSTSKTPHSRSHRDGPKSPRMQEGIAAVEGWRLTWTTNGVNDTAIFEKPAEATSAC